VSPRGSLIADTGTTTVGKLADESDYFHHGAPCPAQ
jgi:hypothetical protein